MTRRVLTAMGSATAVAAAVGTCLLLSPAPQAQAASSPLCSIDTSTNTKNCVSYNSKTGSLTATQTNTTTNKTTSTATFSWNPFCVTGTNSSGSASFPYSCR